MDQDGLSAAELDSALSFLEGANAFLGGWAMLRRRIEFWREHSAPGETMTVLDVGTGAGDIPRRILAWGRERGVRVSVTGIDADERVLRIARRRAPAEPGLEFVRADLREFASRGRRFDYVLGSLVLHHVPPPELPGFLRLCGTLAERGMFFGDLRRGAAAYVGVRAATMFAGRVSRHDGPLSVRRAFRPEELEAAAAEAGLGWLSVRAEPFFRLSLSGEKL
jgi:2-polyprenyl-3-methyl-5-hydroxy-6-metoxy-1,4-benzoquinol methylase